MLGEQQAMSGIVLFLLLQTTSSYSYMAYPGQERMFNIGSHLPSIMFLKRQTNIFCPDEICYLMNRLMKILRFLGEFVSSAAAH